jgi:hypothetical protein
MTIIKVLISLIVAILKATAEGLLAILALGAAWAAGIAALLAVVLVAVFGLSGWRWRAGRKRDS